MLTPATMRCVFTGCPNIQLIRVKLSAAHPTAGMPVEMTASHWSPVFGISPGWRVLITLQQLPDAVFEII